MKRSLCPHCKGRLTAPERIHDACIAPWADAQAQKAERRAAKASKAAQAEERRQDRTAKESQKGLRTLLAEAQTAFNAFIRARDEGLPCICCGSPIEPQKYGGSADAGHFRARSVAPHLRFNEDNVFAQRKNCNMPGGTTYTAFRNGVIARIGQERCDAVENDHSLHKWTRNEVRGIRDAYKKKLRDLLTSRATNA